MKTLKFLTLVALVWGLSNVAFAGKITGEYLEARTCNVYTGPCFANAEMTLAGKEALMAWKVDRGDWNNVKLDGLSAAVIVKAESTLGTDGVFPMQAGRMQAVILIDDKSTPEQHDALLAFVQDTAKDYTQKVLKVQRVPIELKNDHVSHVGRFKAGDMAEIETRKLKTSDCTCTNEVVYYLPLTKVENESPAYSLKLSYQGQDLGTRFINRGIRSAFLATFRKSSS